MKLYFYLKRTHEVEKFIRKLVRHSALKKTTSEKPTFDLVKSDIRRRSKAFESLGTDPCFCSSENEGCRCIGQVCSVRLQAYSNANACY